MSNSETSEGTKSTITYGYVYYVCVIYCISIKQDFELL
jgi:hypothetical protein